MNVILEGCDGGGKSTLAQVISDATGARVQQGSGPPKAPGEIEARAAAYLDMDRVIFDRHPCISQPVYAEIRGEKLSPKLQSRIAQLYSQDTNLYIYCRSDGLEHHVVKGHEDPAHIAALVAKFDSILISYDRWALAHAHMIYRIGEDVRIVVQAAQTYLGTGR